MDFSVAKKKVFLGRERKRDFSPAIACKSMKGGGNIVRKSYFFELSLSSHVVNGFSARDFYGGSYFKL